MFDPAVAVALAVLAAVYLLGVRRARGRGGWPWWRVACFVVLGLGGIAVCTMSSLAVYDHTHLWALAAQLTLLLALVPVALALGDPVGLARAALGDSGRRRLERVLVGPVVRVLTFPVVAAVLATTFLVVVFFTGILHSALSHAAVMDVLYLAALVVGCLAALPMLGAELLPEWCTEPFRLLFAFVDGLFDAIPGVLVMTTGRRLADGWFAGRPDDPNWDVHTAGALMLALGAVILVTLAVPVLLLGLFVLRLPYDAVAGIVAGACGNPAILAYSNKLTPTDQPDVGYAMIFPSMTIVKILFVSIAAAFL